eukprot:scaffold7352_cov254-Pinguiococcus_pyrenoidosus.AAC.16
MVRMARPTTLAAAAERRGEQLCRSRLHTDVVGATQALSGSRNRLDRYARIDTYQVAVPDHVAEDVEGQSQAQAIRVRPCTNLLQEEGRDMHIADEAPTNRLGAGLQNP